MFQASIFPISAWGERRIELEYTQALTADNGLVKYSYPLNTEKFSALPLEKVAVTVELETISPIRAVYSPSHTVDVKQVGLTSAVASYEASNLKPDADFDLFYSFGEEEAMHHFTYRDGRDPADPDGFFVLLAAPDLILLQNGLKRYPACNGSFRQYGRGEMQQAKSAARYVLSHLGTDDALHITTFSSTWNTMQKECLPHPK